MSRSSVVPVSFLCRSMFVRSWGYVQCVSDLAMFYVQCVNVLCAMCERSSHVLCAMCECFMCNV